MEGKKDDKDKLRYDLVKPEMLEELAKALHNGAKKYGDDNYKLVDNERYVAALFRHLQAWRKGETVDKDSGLHPLSHALACVAILLQKDIEATSDYLNDLEREFLINEHFNSLTDEEDLEQRINEWEKDNPDYLNF